MLKEANECGVSQVYYKQILITYCNCLSSFGDICWRFVNLAKISGVIRWYNILKESLIDNMIHNRITHIFQLKIKIIKTSELRFWWWITIRSKRNSSWTSSSIMIIYETFWYSHIRFFKTICKNQNIGARLYTKITYYIIVLWRQIKNKLWLEHPLYHKYHKNVWIE